MRDALKKIDHAFFRFLLVFLSLSRFASERGENPHKLHKQILQNGYYTRTDETIPSIGRRWIACINRVPIRKCHTKKSSIQHFVLCVWASILFRLAVVVFSLSLWIHFLVKNNYVKQIAQNWAINIEVRKHWKHTISTVSQFDLAIVNESKSFKWVSFLVRPPDDYIHLMQWLLRLRLCVSVSVFDYCYGHWRCDRHRHRHAIVKHPIHVKTHIFGCSLSLSLPIGALSGLRTIDAHWPM